MITTDTGFLSNTESYTRRLERRLPHPPETVWRALTDNNELADWFPTNARKLDERTTKTPRASGFSRTGGPSGPPKLTVCNPPRMLEYLLGDETLCWELEPRDGKTLVIFTHTAAEHSKAGDVASWMECFDSLGRRLAGGRA
jgi:uncharacterized protein YndB with AHSA1/START domain